MEFTEIKTFEDACASLNIDPAAVLPDVSRMPEHHQAAVTDFSKLAIIAEALNGGWRPDWSNDDETKYYPWFDLSSGFSFHDYAGDCSHSSIGGRLCYKSRAIAEYAGKQFLGLYQNLMTFNKQS